MSLPVFLYIDGSYSLLLLLLPERKHFLYIYSTAMMLILQIFQYITIAAPLVQVS